MLFRSKIEPPETEISIDIPLLIGDELGTQEVDMSAIAGAIATIGQITSTTSASLTRDREDIVNFVPYDEPPVIIGSISPAYPEFARQNKIQGTVVLEVEVLKDGSVRDIHVKRSVFKALDDAAIDAVKKVKFQPGKSSGQPVDVLLIIPIEFRP